MSLCVRTQSRAFLKMKKMFFLDADVFIQPRENHTFSNDYSGGEDPDEDVIQLSGNQLRGQAELEIYFLNVVP